MTACRNEESPGPIYLPVESKLVGSTFSPAFSFAAKTKPTKARHARAQTAGTKHRNKQWEGDDGMSRFYSGEVQSRVFDGYDTTDMRGAMWHSLRGQDQTRQMLKSRGT